MSWLQPRKGSLPFILSNNDYYDFDVKFRYYGFVGFVNKVIDCECLRCVFCFRNKEKEKRCHLPLIFQRHLPNSNISVSSNHNPYDLATTKEGGLAFYIE